MAGGCTSKECLIHITQDNVCAGADFNQDDPMSISLNKARKDLKDGLLDTGRPSIDTT